MIRTTHTYVILELSKPAFKEIEQKLMDAGYQHAMHEDDGRTVIDMHGIAVADEEKTRQSSKSADRVKGQESCGLPTRMPFLPRAARQGTAARIMPVEPLARSSRNQHGQSAGFVMGVGFGAESVI